MPANVLIVDDERSMQEFLSILMRRDGYETRTVGSAEDALLAVEQRWPDLVLTDLSMPGLDGMGLLRELKARGARRDRSVEVVMITAYGSTGSAVEAIKAGAADYVLKPFNNEELLLVVKRTLARQRLEEENSRLRDAIQDRYHFDRLVGSSRAMAAVYALVRRVKDSRINCLLVGESGTGKEMVARAIHFSGNRAEEPFVPVNCGAIPDSLVESELFGHRKGSFTGAVRDKVGFLEAADRGTLFLDEVNSLSPAAQVSLLRVIQERRFTRVGDTREREVDIRLIAASNQDLEALVASGGFREDLYYRLNVVQIPLPPLRDRREDIDDLVKHFIRRYAQEYGSAVRGVESAALEALRAWSWPGNVRELQNTIERAVVLCSGSLLDLGDLPQRLVGTGATPLEEVTPSFPEAGVDLDAILQQTERSWLLAALKESGGNKTRAAALLNMSFRSFRYRLAKLGMDTGG